MLFYCLPSASSGVRPKPKPLKPLPLIIGFTKQITNMILIWFIVVKTQQKRFDFKLGGQSYEGADASRFNTEGYTRFELLSFYKHHFDQLEELLAPKGYIDFQLSDPLSRFEIQDMEFPVSGLNKALDHALDTCQGWT